MTRRQLFQTFAAMMVAICLLLSAVVSAQGNSDNAFERVKEVQEQHTSELMAKAGVVGTAVGLDDQGQAAVLVLLENAAVGGVPEALDGVPVQPLVTGKIEALAKPSGNPGHGGSTQSPTSVWTRPVPIGVSTGNAGQCSAGTISCRVQDTLGNVYALSNNHVYALENTAPLGSEILQPGRYDTQCAYDAANVIGTLYYFVPIAFGGNNTVDCAIAATTTDDLGAGTPPDGYGTPKSATVLPAVNMAVQKYGRTTSLTKGTITGINATVNVGYSTGTATFVHQIVVQSRKAFIKAGDSGSLLVTNPGTDPVGLLFAGNQSGTYAVANRIDDVLSALDVTIDGN
jgi:hypothetical protein